MTRVQRGGIILVVLVAVLAALVLFSDRLVPRRQDPAMDPPPPSVAPSPSSKPAPDPAPQAAAARVPDRRAALVLTPAEVRESTAASGGVLAGRVVSFSTGEGVANADLTFGSEAGTWSVVSAADGSFSFAPDSPGVYDLVAALADGYLPFAPAWGQTPIRFFGRPGLRIEGALVTLVPAVRYTGLVVDPDGRPVADAAVQLAFPANADPALAPIQDRYVSGPDGTFAFSAPDDTLVRASHPDHAPAWGRVDFKVQVSKRLVLTLGPGQDAPAGVIAGRVQDADGAPVDSAQVIAMRASDGPFDPVSGRGHVALSGSDGAFELDLLPEGAFDVGAGQQGFAPVWARDVPVGSRDVVLTLDAALAGRIEGSVSSGGAPVPNFTVLVTRRTGPISEHRVTHAAFFDPEGRYAVEGLGAGDYRVRAVAFGFGPSAPVDVNLADPPVDVGRADLELPRGGTLTGAVVSDPSGEPLTNARVTAEGGFGDGASLMPIAATATTDAAGRFELPGLAAGLRSVTAAAAGHNPRIVSGLRVVEGQVLGPMEIALTELAEGEEPALELAGIGARLHAEGEALAIVGVIAGGGAAEAGLVPGDAILAVDGTPVVELGFDGAIQVIRGPEGTTVRLSLRRAGGETIDMPVFRRRIKAQ